MHLHTNAARGRSTPRPTIHAVAGLATAVVLLAWAPVRAQPVDTMTAPAASGPEAVQDSPRGSLARFLEQCRRGHYEEAARYLDLPREDVEHGAELARRLKVVLDRHAWIDLSAVSPLPDGDVEDGLPAGVDQVAEIPTADGSTEPVRLARRAEHGHWAFTPATVRRVNGWYEALDQRWLLERLPGRLLRPGPFELLYWQWLALPVLFVAAWLAGLLLGRSTRAVLTRIVRRTETKWDDEIFARMGGPLTLAWGLVAVRALLPWLGLYQPAADAVHSWIRAGFLLAFFWSLIRGIDVGREIIAASPWAMDHSGLRSLLPLGARVGKVLVLGLAAVALLSELGYPVASLVAGLGIGGLALALAAQKTVENLFGAFSIGADQPFRQGDFVRIQDFVGTVEAIGLRSTRIRTLDRTVISIPNGQLADMRLESLTERDRMRLACTVGLVYGTTAAQMRQVLDGFERVLRAHRLIWPDAVVVRFKEFGDSSLNIEVMAWFQTREFSEFQFIRQEILLEFMDVVERAGSSFAFPTRTVHLVQAPD